MPVHVERSGAGWRYRDAGLFNSFAKGCRGNGCVVDVDVATQLNPELPLLVETQEDSGEVVGEDEATGGEVGPVGFTGERPITPGVEKSQVVVTQRLLRLVLRRPRL